MGNEFQEILEGFEDDYQFTATPPTFSTPIDTFASGAFDAQTDWLITKRDQCIRDLQKLRQTLDAVVRHATRTERADALNAVIRQVNGAYSEIDHVENLIERIHPGFDLASLPPLPKFKSRRDAAWKQTPGYYAEVRHAA